MSTARLRVLLPAAAAALALLAAGCGGGERDYRRPPTLLRSVAVGGDGEGSRPARLQVLGDTLFVGFTGAGRIDAYTLDLRRVRSIALRAPAPVRPSAFVVTDSAIVVCDHARRAVAVFDRDGAYRVSYDRLPDGGAALSPLAVAVQAGVAYVTDSAQRRVLAIALDAVEGVRDAGELILSIPGAGSPPLAFPSAVHVTADGRLLVGDAGAGRVRVFTCDGRAIYDFEPVPEADGMAPQGFAEDRRPDPGLEDEHSFDPSGVREQGRIHVVDGRHGLVRMFNPLGRYLGAYPVGSRLAGPAGIAVDGSGGRVYVADPPAGRILVYDCGS